MIESSIGIDEKVQEIVELAQQRKIKIDKSSPKKIQLFAKSGEHQGVACEVIFRTKNTNDINWDEDKAYIYISESHYEHNIGAITRTAECAGFGGVIFPKNISVNSLIAKISTGAIFHIPIYSGPIYQTIKEFKNKGFSIYGIERGGKRYFDVELDKRSLFIIGGEDKSLSEGVSKECNEILEIPQFGKINSLNMSNASSIVIYEYVRQNILKSE